MDDGAVARIVADLIDAQIEAKLKPIVGMIVGLETAFVHMFNILDHRGVMTRQAAIVSLQATREALPANAVADVGMVLRQIELGLASLPQEDPAGPPPSTLN